MLRHPLPLGRCHLWYAQLGGCVDESSLSLEEQQRAGRFLVQWARSRYVAGRVILRRLCASYLDIDPAMVGFGQGTQGKPYLDRSMASGSTELDPGLFEFNLAHCDDIAVLAFARELPVGVDVERVRPMTDMEEIGREFLTPPEMAMLRTLSGRAREQLFFRAWTRKEAYAKLTGEGLASVLGCPVDPGCWFYEFEPAPGFLGTLAMAREPDGVEVREFAW